MPATRAKIDFTNVKEGGARFTKRRVPAGDYLARVVSVEDAQPKDKTDKSQMWLFTIQLEGRKSCSYPYYCKLVENQLWKVRNLFVAAGINVPKKAVTVDPEKVVGRLIGVSLEDTEYDGKEQSEVAGVIPSSEVEGAAVDDVDTDDDDDDDDEEETPPVAKKAAKKPAPVVDEDDEDEDDEEDEPEPPKKKAKAKPAPVDDDDEDELDIEDL